MGFAETYVAVNEKFYCFPLVKAVIGVEFANLYDAKYFKRLVDKFAFGGDPKQVLKEEKKKWFLDDAKEGFNYLGGFGVQSKKSVEIDDENKRPKRRGS